MTSTSAHIAAYSLTDFSPTTGAIMGSVEQLQALPTFSNIFVSNLFGSGNIQADTNGSIGLWMVNRVGTAVTGYKNDFPVVNGTSTSGGVPGNTIHILSENTNGIGDGGGAFRVAFASMGAGMTPLQQAQFYQIMCQAMAQVGTLCSANGVANKNACLVGDNQCPLTEVNPMAFGATCNGRPGSNDTAAFYAAVAYQAANKIQTFQLPPPPAQCILTPPFFFDLPGNLAGGRETYGAGTGYNTNMVVSYNGTLYISLQDSQSGHQPNISPTFWTPFLWNSGTTYALNDIRQWPNSSGISVPWLSLASGNTNHTPVLGSSWWTPWAVVPQQAGNFTMVMAGARGGASGRTLSVVIDPPSAPGVVIGPGSNMCAENFQVIGKSGAYRNQLPRYGVGVVIAGGSGGAQNTCINNMQISNFNRCIETGTFQDQLGADNDFNRLVVDNCYVGISISKTQNDINMIHHAVSGQSTIALWANVGKDTRVDGGNWSPIGSKSNAFGISSISSVAKQTCPDFTHFDCYKFTGVIASPDAYWGTPDSGGMQGTNAVYNSFMLNTPNFGVIPLIMDPATPFNTGTNVATFYTWYNWGVFHFGNSHTILDDTALATDIQAATTVYAVERQTIFLGANIRADKIFSEESAFSCWTLISKRAGFGQNLQTRLTNIVSSDPSNYNLRNTGRTGSNNPALWAIYLCSKAFPFIEDAPNGAGGSLTIEDLATVNYEPVMIDLANPDSIDTFNNVLLGNPNVRATYTYVLQAAPFTGADSNGNFLAPPLTMTGQWNPAPWIVFSGANAINRPYRLGLGSTPFWGYYPAPYAAPRLAPSMYTKLSGTLPAIGSYLLPYGGTPYTTLDQFTGANAGGKLHATVAMLGCGYGQNLTASAGNGQISGLSWSYKGQSFLVHVDPNTMNSLMPGCHVILNNGGRPQTAVVVGMQPTLGTIDVIIADNSPLSGTRLLNGNKTTTYTGTTIGQTPYVWTQY
jgi:hypothetical protein